MKQLLIVLFVFVVLPSMAQDSALVFHPKRLITLEGGSNFRDLGGYPAGRKHVKWGKIFRSADISKLTDNDLTKLSQLHLAVVCDLRGPDEVKNGPDKIPSQTRYLNLPAGSEQLKINPNFNQINADSMMRSIYAQTSYLKAKYRPMFDEMLQMPTDQALMFHCTAGKDRTGIGAALILSALGVDKKYIIADYTATDVFWKLTREKMLQAMASRGGNPEKLRALLEAQPAYIQSFFDTIDKNFGSMDNFLHQELGLSNTQLKKLKKQYLQ